ncbi:ADP-ribosylation factor family-domain-containing protein [Zopfochytrium polystomum]|nr:ADP-ribosylation factor family-domain-containing protein [Zopfochytrium polystomum]
MYTLLSGIYEMYTRKDDFYIIILGLDNAGKTVLLERIKSTYTGAKAISPDKIGPTVGLNIGKIEVGRVRLNFWDLGGQRELRRLWEKYYSESHAILFVVDSADPDRIEEAKEQFGDIITCKELEGVPLLMLANKSDRPGSISAAGMKHLFNDLALNLGARDSRVMSTSGLKGEGVRDAIDWLFLRLERNRVNRPPIRQGA